MPPAPARSTSGLRVVAALAAAGAFATTAYAAEAGAPPAGEASAPIVLPAPKDFAEAVVALERATGVKGEAVELGGASVPLSEGRAFAVDGRTAERLLAGSHRVFLKAKLYLFRLERAFGLAGDKDPLVLLATADRSAVVRRVGTSSPRDGVTTEKVVAWLEALAKEEPFELTEVGVDYLAGRFERTPKDPAEVARRSVELAPGLVAGRASTLALLAEEIRTARTLYLIW